MGPTQSRTAAEYQAKRIHVSGSYRRQCPDDMPVLAPRLWSLWPRRGLASFRGPNNNELSERRSFFNIPRSLSLKRQTRRHIYRQMRPLPKEPSPTAPSPFAWVLRRLRLHTRHYLTGALAAAGTSAAAMADPFILQWLTDHAIAYRSAPLLFAGAAGLFAASALRQGLNAVSTLANFRAANGFSLRLRRDAIRHAGRLGADYHSRVTPGHNQFLVERDVELLTESLHRGISQVIALFTSVAFAALAVYHFESRLLIAAIPLNLALLALKHRFGPALNDAAAATQSTAASASATLQDHLNAITQLQLLPGLLWRERAVLSASVAYTRTAAHKQKTELLFGAGAGLVTATGLCSLIVIAGPRLVSGDMTAGAFLATYLCMGQLFAPALLWSDLVNRLTQTRTILARVHAFLAEPVNPSDSPNPQPITPPIAIAITNISFAFPSAAPILQIDSLTLNPGEILAVIGPSGSGKTTLGRLLLRQFDPQRGAIRYNGARLPDLHLRSLRGAIAFCPQAPLFFSGTLRDNLRAARPGATSSEIWDALRLAALHTVVAALELGLDEPIGPAAGRLSAGERQRLALARALLQDSAILILDEATSALDPVTEILVMDNLRENLGNKACLFITHRTVPLEYADRVVTIRDGCTDPLSSTDARARHNKLPAPAS